MSLGTLLKANLPTAFNTALTQVTGVGQVYVARKPRLAVGTVEVWIRPPLSFGQDLAGGGLAEPQVRWPYRVRIEKSGGDEDDLEEFVRESFVHFHTKRTPNVAGLRHMLIENVVHDLHPGSGPVVACAFDLVAISREPISTGT